MDRDSASAPPARWSEYTDDPLIAALLDFEPVPRKCARRDGWTAEAQRRYVAGLAVSGCRRSAAEAVGLTGRGAYQLRKDAGGDAFGEACDAALALHRARNPGMSRGERRLHSSDAPDLDSAGDEAVKLEVFDRILEKYVRKLDQERCARLDGRIIEADFCVRQLTYIEICLDLGRRALDVLQELQRGGLSTTRIAATPMSLYLDWVRRLYWKERDEPERPPLAGFGHRTDEVAAAEHDYYSFGEHGPHDEWKRRREADRAVAAEAQRLWEEKAKADAEAWAARVEAGAAPEGDDTIDFE